MKILLPVDGSESSLLTLQWASLFLDKDHTEAYVLNVVEDTADVRITEQITRKSQNLLEDAKAFLEKHGFDVAQVTELYGDPAATICDFVNHFDIQQIIMATNQRKGLSRLTIGSVSQTVFKDCTAQVLLLETSEKPALKMSYPPGTEHLSICQNSRDSKTVNNVLLPLDDSEGSRETLEWVTRFLNNASTRFYLLHVIEMDIGIEDSLRRYYESQRIVDVAKRYLKSQGFQTVHAESIVDDPVAGICRYAAEQNVNYIVIGSIGHGLTKALLGSTSQKVYEKANQPVLLVKNAKNVVWAS